MAAAATLAAAPTTTTNQKERELRAQSVTDHESDKTLRRFAQLPNLRRQKTDFSLFQYPTYIV